MTPPRNHLTHPALYEIVVEGAASPGWADWFDGLAIKALPGGLVGLSGELPDQSALHGVLEQIRDLNLNLVSIRLVDEP
jgi:hypothetical protein